MFTPEFNIYDQGILLLVGLIAIYLLVRFFTRYSNKKLRYDIYYMVSFAVLLVAGLLLIILTYSALDNPLVEIVGVLIPTGLALGLVAQFFDKYETPFQGFALVGLVAVAITRLTMRESTIATIVLVIVHAFSGFLVLVLPFLAARLGKTRGAFVSVSLGGLLIDVGGMALAFLATGRELFFFSADMVLTVLAPLLLLMVLAFAYGFARDFQHQAA
jgi:hypothetical protein